MVYEVAACHPERAWACGPPEGMKISGVVPAKARTQVTFHWIPDFAGMT